MLKFTVSIPLDGVDGPPISWPVSRSRAVGSGGPFSVCIILSLFSVSCLYVDY
jgi:hypothetical protein